MMKKKPLFALIALLSSLPLMPEELGIGYLKYFEKSYPDVKFSKSYDSAATDWKITLEIPDSAEAEQGGKRTAELYWAGARMLPASELKNSENYWPLLYGYAKVLEDPAAFSEERRESIKKFSSSENRRNGAGTPMFFFDAIYDSATRKSVESHIKRVKFLAHGTNIHERIKEPLAMVESEIQSLAKTDPEVKTFVDEIKSADAYYWRIIQGTSRRSFHSLGLAVDILPVSQHGKQIFWSWAKDKYPDTWMLIPLKDRWMPPEKVIQIFERHGFIWGGKWAIYDNMHFEFHPELIYYNFGTPAELPEAKEQPK